MNEMMDQLEQVIEERVMQLKGKMEEEKSQTDQAEKEVHRAVITVNGIMERISCFREGYEGQNEVLMHRSDLVRKYFLQCQR